MAPDGDVGSGFGALLRARRRAAGLTQAELAERAGVGERTVRDLENGRSARPQRTTVELLAGALGLAGPDQQGFLAVARGKLAAPSPPGGSPHSVISLPAAPDLIGRDEEIAGLMSHLRAQAGVTTLVGLAGTGKSVLALAVANKLEGYFAGGVAGISLAHGDTAVDVREVICAVFGITRMSEIPARFAEPGLLFVDGVDRAGPVIAAVLAEVTALAPKLRVIASARAPLGLNNETIWPVGTLAVPPAEVSTLAEARLYPASALFLARWTQVRGTAADDVDVGALVALVRRLGGLPLALELAAARGRVLDPPEMLVRYGDRLLELGDADTSTTLRDVVTASYRLLDPTLRWALRRLSGFGYRWSIELAEAMLGQDTDVVPVLERLVELGLVQVRGSGAFRFFLLDVVKAYALEQAEIVGELAEIRSQHAVVFARFAARTAPELVGAKLPGAVARLDDVASDLWSALAYATDHDPHTALCLASKLPRWWRFRGRDVQGRQWLLKLVDDPRTADAEPRVRRWAQLGVAQMAAEHGDGPEELHRAELALEEFVRAGDVTGELAARVLLIIVQQGMGNYGEARRHGEAALTVATRAGRVRDMAVAQNNLIWHDLRAADLAAAQRRLAAVDRLSVRCGEHQLRAVARANLAEVLRLDGRYEEAIHVGLQAAEMLAEVGSPAHRRRLLGLIGLSYASSGQLEQAEKTLGELRGMLPGSDRAGEVDDDWDCSMIEATLARRRGQRTLAAAWYQAAARSTGGLTDQRDRAEALVGLIATSDDPEPARAELDELCFSAGITLTALERKQLAE
jgi:predicted ATPase/transcriptional regulator with XRE-family HTH domain/tetratricopeptide (TPR) repeat protein